MGRMVVWKYWLNLDADVQVLNIPQHAQLVHVEYIDFVGNRGFNLWYEVQLSLKNELSARRFKIFGTGDESIPSYGKYIGCGISWAGGDGVPVFVWHLYDLGQTGNGV